MNASKFDQLTFENLNKYPQNTIQFFLDKFDFADEAEFAYHLGRIYGSEEKGWSIINAKKKKEEKLIERGKRRGKKKQKSLKLLDETATENPTTEIGADEESVEIKVEETAVLGELSELKLRLAEDQEMLKKTENDIAKKMRLNVHLRSNVSFCSDRVKKLEAELEKARILEELNREQLRRNEKLLTEGCEMRDMLFEEIDEIKSKLQKSEQSESSVQMIVIVNPTEVK